MLFSLVVFCLVRICDRVITSDGVRVRASRKKAMQKSGYIMIICGFTFTTNAFIATATTIDMTMIRVVTTSAAFTSLNQDAFKTTPRI